MRKNYLLLAASALLLASCSNEADGPKNDVDNNEDVLTLTTLDPSSQASRIVKAADTRVSDKITRLNVEYTIAPVKAAADYTWSATGIDFTGTEVFVSWHADRQATTAATKWGGAVDHITGFPDNLSMGETWVNYDAKFNNVLVDGNELYFPLTDAKKGAAIARVRLGSELGPIRKLEGTSANALEIKDGLVYAVTGYTKGGVFTISKDFPAYNKKDSNSVNLVKTVVEGNNFGGKYIVGDYVLRTDDQAAYIYDIAKEKEYNIGAPLKSEEKAAEKYDPETGEWSTDGAKAAYYGKHTMAVDDKYIYVAGGQAEKGTQNGLRVIDKETMQQVWGNATNTTAVCVADGYVYAATGAGLRVYKAYDGNTLELFAFETVPGEDGKLVAGTDVHSCNYVAVKGEYVYVACGQSGVRIFKLDKSAPAQEEDPAE